MKLGLLSVSQVDLKCGHMGLFALLKAAASLCSAPFPPLKIAVLVQRSTCSVSALPDSYLDFDFVQMQ